MTAYYNEIDPYAAQWLRNLIATGHIAPGDVDERDIRDVKPDELRHYTQCHLFAGVGIWSLALRRAGWSDDTPVWTGSCPCQPFSTAGRKGGTDDERHLWPHWYHLITQCEPNHIFGEQVASKDGLGWLDLVQTDLEGADYAHGTVDLCAAGVGSPNIRQRLWFVAEWLEYPEHEGSQGRVSGRPNEERENIDRYAGCDGATRRVGDSAGYGLDSPEGHRSNAQTCAGLPKRSDVSRQPARAGHPGNGGLLPRSESRVEGRDLRPIGHPADPTNGHWRGADWLLCRDGKFRPVEPGTFPLADGAANRVGQLRAYGNGINVEAAQAFIESYLDGVLIS